MPPCGVEDDQDVLSGGHEADAMAITRNDPVSLVVAPPACFGTLMTCGSRRCHSRRPATRGPGPATWARALRSACIARSRSTLARPHRRRQMRTFAPKRGCIKVQIDRLWLGPSGWGGLVGEDRNPSPAPALA